MSALLQGLLIVAYPLLIYLGLSTLGVRTTALWLLAATLLNAALRWTTGSTAPRTRDNAKSWTVLLLPLITALVLLASAASNHPGFLLALPALINLALLLTFGLSLLTQLPLVERFARWHVSDLRPEEVRYCRSVTGVWCLFFLSNGATAAATALWAPLSWWSFYNGVVAYGLMGLLFAGEFLVRKYRFRRFSTAFYDRWLMNLFRSTMGHTASAPLLRQDDLIVEAEDRVRVSLRIPAESHYFVGHFPGRPILPGVVQLIEIVLPAVEQAWPELGALQQVRRLKFKELIVPGDELEARIERVGNEARFRITRADRECAMGVLEFSAPRSP